MTFEKIIEEESKKEYFIKLTNFIKEERKTKKILPKESDVFNAFKYTSLDNIKVVIIGQDPYPTDGVPMGLAFGVNKNTKIPASLNNIFKELKNEFPNFEIPNNGDLTPWAKKGILLLNQVLTVECGKPLSHKNIGWKNFIKRIIEEIEKIDNKIIYILWGNQAQDLIIKNNLVTNKKHMILTSSHPSPLSARVSFFGSNIFLKVCNELNLKEDFWSLK